MPSATQDGVNLQERAYSEAADRQSPYNLELAVAYDGHGEDDCASER